MFIHTESLNHGNYHCSLFDVETGIDYSLHVPRDNKEIGLTISAGIIIPYRGQNAISFWMQLIASVDAPFTKNMTAVKKIEEWIERNKE